MPWADGAARTHKAQTGEVLSARAGIDQAAHSGHAGRVSAPHPQLDRKKLEQVVLFFLERINNTNLGRTKLMKLLYYVDFDHYENHGKAITWAKYRKLPHGPVPDKADKVVDKMVSSGALTAIVGECGGYTQNRLVSATAEFDASLFTADELLTLQAVAARWEHATAKEIESASHREAPWASTDDQKAIDYELAEYRKPMPDEEIDGVLAKSGGFAKLVESIA